MSNTKDITNIEDIELLVNTFYERVRNNDLLAPIFNNIIQDRWAEHLGKMYRFWQTVLLGEHTYYGKPFPPHARLPVRQQHFDTWLSLWHETIDKYYAGEKADEAKWRGNKMAVVLLSKIEYYRNS